jgi:long-chain acyl-CoA synthetase
MSYDARPWLASYPADVPTEFDVPQVALPRLLDDAAAAFPASIALAASGATFTYRRLRELVDRFAGGLSSLDVVAGDRVALVLPNCPQHVIAFFAVLRLGATVVQCNPLSTEAELADQLSDCAPTVVVCLDTTFDVVEQVRARVGVRHVVVTSLADYLPSAQRLRLRMPLPSARAARARLTADISPRDRVEQFRALAGHQQRAGQVAVDPATAVAVLQYTGGTTGRSKAAKLSHANLVANAYQMRLWLPEATSGRETTLAVLPLFHVYGLTLCLLTTMLLAGRLVLLPRFDLDLVFDAIDTERPTLFPGVPPIYQALLDAPRLRRTDLHSIRACVSGAMKLPVDVQERFERVTGGRLVEGYGTTETSPATHCQPLSGPRRPGSVGLPLPGTDARIVDPDDPSRVVPVGEPGELAVRGPQVFLGYWSADSGEQPLLHDGWLLTGDIATMDDAGFFSIVDRKKDLVIAGGFNIYPAELEAVIRSHEAVADCCVIGLPDRYRGETVKAFVVPRAGMALRESDIIDHCAARLTAYKVPKLVELRDDLPRTAIGKALRRMLVAEELAKGGSAT